MYIIFLGLLVGLVIGFLVPISLSGVYSLYFAVAILAAIDSIAGGIRSNLQGRFDNVLFLTGFVGNATVALLLSYIGDQLGVPLYYTALFVFGSRLFKNVSIIRRLLLRR